MMSNGDVRGLTNSFQFYSMVRLISTENKSFENSSHCMNFRANFTEVTEAQL